MPTITANAEFLPWAFASTNLHEPFFGVVGGRFEKKNGFGRLADPFAQFSVSTRDSTIRPYVLSLQKYNFFI